MKFLRLKEEHLKILAHRYIAIKELLKVNLNYEVKEAKEDLQAFQNVIDLKIIDPESGSHFFEGMGIVLGRMLITNRKGFDWWVMEDGVGQDIVLRYKETDFYINVIGHIASQIQNGRYINIQNSFVGLVKDIDQFFVPTLNKA